MLPPIPEPSLRACLAVLQYACLHARLLGYEGESHGLPPRRAQLLADLMDAVHNLPQLILRWPECNEALLRGMLAGFDEKWAGEDLGLLAVFEETMGKTPP